MPVRQDLYWVWAEQTEYASYDMPDPALYVQVLIELVQGKNPNDFHAWLQRSGSGPKGFVPAVYKKPNLLFCTAWIAQKEIANLPADVVKRFKLGAAIPGTRQVLLEQFQEGVSVQGQARALSKRHLSGRKVTGPVLLAIIDDDINFEHATFVNGAASRFQLTWDQNTNRSLCAIPPKFGYTLNSAAKSFKSKKQVASHGTAVASLAGGKETPQHRLRNSKLIFNIPKGPDGASNVPLAGVVLPLTTVADTSGGALAGNVYDALTFLTDARNVANNTHIIVNLSFGTMAGPHDGTSLLDAALCDLLKRRNDKLKFVVPAGNSFESQCHARFELGGGQSTETIWRVLPDDRTPSFIEIWLPKGSMAEVTLRSPDGASTLFSAAMDDLKIARNTSGKAFAAIIRRNNPANGDNRQMVLLAISPTRANGTTVTAPHGDWKCTVKNTPNATALPVRMWVERDNASFGQPTRGRQSYLIDSEAVRKPASAYRLNKPSMVTGFGSLNAMACETNTLVVAGYDLKTGQTIPESAAGSNDGEVRCPDGAAPAAESPMLPGLLGAAHTGSGVVRMGGTSAATPTASRFLVNELLNGSGIHRPDPFTQIPHFRYDERSGLGNMEF